jgi:signal transduction histidine kinase
MHEIQVMPQLAVVSDNVAPAYTASIQVAHDLRNLLASVGLHLETLQRLAGPSGVKAADAAHALLMRGAALCNKSLDRCAGADRRARRRGVDLIQTARDVAELLGPSAPKDFCFDIHPNAGISVLADPDEAFRILFNLMSNAVAVANRKEASLTKLTLHISTENLAVTMHLADDGPGLPAAVRAGLFGARWKRTSAPRHGYGLAIARELAERNGGTLALAPSAKGATFALKLPAFLSMITHDTPRYPRRQTAGA